MKLDTKVIIIIFLTTLIGLGAGVVIATKFFLAPVVATAEVLKDYKDDVAKKIRKNASQLQDCYNEFLKKDPKIKEGKIDFVFKVEEDGKVSTFEIVENELKDTPVEDCLSKVIKKTRFTPPPPGVNKYISHSILYESPESAQRRINERFPKVLPQKPL